LSAAQTLATNVVVEKSRHIYFYHINPIFKSFQPNKGPQTQNQTLLDFFLLNLDLFIFMQYWTLKNYYQTSLIVWNMWTSITTILVIRNDENDNFFHYSKIQWCSLSPSINQGLKSDKNKILYQVWYFKKVSDQKGIMLKNGWLKGNFCSNFEPIIHFNTFFTLIFFILIFPLINKKEAMGHQFCNLRT
jgi:hypothetical protein